MHKTPHRTAEATTSTTIPAIVPPPMSPIHTQPKLAHTDTRENTQPTTPRSPLCFSVCAILFQSFCFDDYPPHYSPSCNATDRGNDGALAVEKRHHHQRPCNATAGVTTTSRRRKPCPSPVPIQHNHKVLQRHSGGNDDVLVVALRHHNVLQRHSGGNDDERHRPAPPQRLATPQIGCGDDVSSSKTLPIPSVLTMPQIGCGDDVSSSKTLPIPRAYAMPQIGCGDDVLVVEKPCPSPVPMPRHSGCNDGTLVIALPPQRPCHATDRVWRRRLVVENLAHPQCLCRATAVVNDDIHVVALLRHNALPCHRQEATTTARPPKPCQLHDSTNLR